MVKKKKKGKKKRKHRLSIHGVNSTGVKLTCAKNIRINVY